MRNAEQVRVAAGGGDIYFAPAGTTLPTSPTARLDAAFVQGGYTTEEGVTLTFTPEITEHRSWQSSVPIRRDLSATDIAVRFSLIQYNADNLVFAFGGGTVEEVGGAFVYTFPGESAVLAENAVVVDWKSGSANFRIVIPRGNVSESVETQFTRTDMTVLPITVRALGGTGNDVRILTDDPTWPTGS